MDRTARDETARKVSGLYVIVDAHAAGDRDLVELTHAALRGGARVIQLRDKLATRATSCPWLAASATCATGMTRSS